MATFSPDISMSLNDRFLRQKSKYKFKKNDFLQDNKHLQMYTTPQSATDQLVSSILSKQPVPIRDNYCTDSMR